MAEPRDSHDAYQQAKHYGVGTSDPRFGAAVEQGLQEHRREQDRRRKAAEELNKAAQESVRNAFSGEQRLAGEKLGEGLYIVLRPIFILSAFGMGIYFVIPALAKLISIGDSSLSFYQFYKSIDGFFALGVAVPMVLILYKLYKKSSKRFWQVNLSLVAVSMAILMI